MEDSERGEAPGQRSLWRHGEFMKLWAGQTVSLLGSAVTLLALPLAAILLFKATAFQVGLLSTVEFLPFLLFGLPVGVWVDRLRRRPILVAADIGRFITIGSVPFAYALGALHLEQLYAVGFLSGTFTVFFDVAYGSYLPTLIDRDRLTEGNSKLEISRSGAQLAGPGVAGILVQAFRAPVALLADAVSYMVSVLSLLSIRVPERVPDRPLPESGGMRRQIGEGLRYVLGHPLLRPLAACTATLNLFSMMAQAVLVLFAVRDLELTPGAIGAILTAGNVGFLVGAFVAQRIARRIGVGPALIGGAVLVGSGLLFVPFATPSTAVPLLVAYGGVASFGGVVYNVNGRSLLQSITTDRMLGRTIASNRFVVWGTIPVGSFVGGILGSNLGLRPTLLIAAFGALIAFVPPLLSPVRRLAEIPRHE